MTIKSTIAHDIIYTEFSGELVLEAALKHIDFILSLKNQFSSIYEVHDHTNTNAIKLSADDIQKIASYSIKLKDYFRPYFISIYAPTDFTFGMARMFQAYYTIAGHVINTEIFRNKEVAIQFLKDNKRTDS